MTENDAWMRYHNASWWDRRAYGRENSPAFLRLKADLQPTRGTSVHVSGPLNSTKFTDCCGLAVTRAQTKCDGCGAHIFR